MPQPLTSVQEKVDKLLAKWDQKIAHEVFWSELWDAMEEIRLETAQRCEELARKIAFSSRTLGHRNGAHEVSLEIRSEFKLPPPTEVSAT